MNVPQKEIFLFDYILLLLYYYIFINIFTGCCRTTTSSNGVHVFIDQIYLHSLARVVTVLRPDLLCGGGGGVETQHC